MVDSIERHSSFASLYDLGILGDWFYRPARRRAINQLNLHSGDVVFDLFCGTGLNFQLLLAELRPEGKIIGLDGSQQMLDKAKSKAREAERQQVELVQVDFTTTSGIRKIETTARQFGARKFLFTLGLTCLPNWRQFFDLVFDAAPPGARFSIMDVYNERLSLGARLMNWVAYSETRRPVWKGLEERSENFQFERRPFRILNWLLEVSVVVASGRKPRGVT